MLYEVVFQQDVVDQAVINRWNYNSTGTPTGVSGALALATAMGFIALGDPPVYPPVTIFSAIRDMQHAEVRYIEVIVRAIYDVLDFYTIGFPTDLGGLGSGGNMASPALALGFRTNRVRQDIARGTKRIGGFPAGFQGAAGVLGQPALDEMTQLATLMGTVLQYTTGGNNLNFTPVIVQKEEYSVPPQKPKYRYYVDPVVQQTHIASGITWQIYNTVRTQTSRQYGHGA